MSYYEMSNKADDYLVGYFYWVLPSQPYSSFYKAQIRDRA